MSTNPALDPHAQQRVVRHGVDPAHARLAVILVHGRGAGPEDVIGLADALGFSDIAYLAPAAAGHTWYPYPVPDANGAERARTDLGAWGCLRTWSAI